MEAARAVDREYQELKAFLMQAKTVQDLLAPKAQSDSDALAMAAERTALIRGTPQVVSRPVAANTLELVDYVFATHGPELHVNDVLKYIHEMGWIGNGDRRDYKNIHQLLSSRPHRFRASGGAKFTRVEEAKKA